MALLSAAEYGALPPHSPSQPLALLATQGTRFIVSGMVAEPAPNTVPASAWVCLGGTEADVAPVLDAFQAVEQATAPDNPSRRDIPSELYRGRSAEEAKAAPDAVTTTSHEWCLVSMIPDLRAAAAWLRGDTWDAPPTPLLAVLATFPRSTDAEGVVAAMDARGPRHVGLSVHRCGAVYDAQQTPLMAAEKYVGDERMEDMMRALRSG